MKTFLYLSKYDWILYFGVGVYNFMFKFIQMYFDFSIDFSIDPPTLENCFGYTIYGLVFAFPIFVFYNRVLKPLIEKQNLKENDTPNSTL